MSALFKTSSQITTLNKYGLASHMMQAGMYERTTRRRVVGWNIDFKSRTVYIDQFTPD